MSRDSYPIENTLSLLIVPRVTNIHLSPAALMNEVTRHNKGFLWVLSQLIPFLSEQIQQNNKMLLVVCYRSATYGFTNKLKQGVGRTVCDEWRKSMSVPEARATKFSTN